MDRRIVLEEKDVELRSVEAEPSEDQGKMCSVAAEL
jgi:hypothetical protein